jgi:ubiquinone/menaquinone biosynthesis C-methylase UbiE
MSFSNPRAIVQALRLREGMRVGDFGAGSGHYALAAAERVGTTGRVIAVDINKDLLTRIRNDATREGLENVEVLWGDIDEEAGSCLNAESLDLVILANVLFQVEHRRAAAREAHRVLRPSGKLLVVDWRDSYGGLGPQISDVISEENARELFESESFAFEKAIGAGEHHYGLLFTKV